MNSILGQSTRGMFPDAEYEAARQQVASMIRGIPLLSMLPAIQHLQNSGMQKNCLFLVIFFINNHSSNRGLRVYRTDNK